MVEEGEGREKMGAEGGALYSPHLPPHSLFPPPPPSPSLQITSPSPTFSLPLLSTRQHMESSSRWPPAAPPGTLSRTVILCLPLPPLVFLPPPPLSWHSLAQ